MDSDYFSRRIHIPDLDWRGRYCVWADPVSNFTVLGVILAVVGILVGIIAVSVPCVSSRQKQHVRRKLLWKQRD